MNPKSETDCCMMSQVICLHACQPSYYSNFLVTLYFVKYNNSIPFFKGQSHQVNKVLIDCLNVLIDFVSRICIHFGRKLEVLITYVVDN